MAGIGLVVAALALGAWLGAAGADVRAGEVTAGNAANRQAAAAGSAAAGFGSTTGSAAEVLPGDAESGTDPGAVAANGAALARDVGAFTGATGPADASAGLADVGTGRSVVSGEPADVGAGPADMSAGPADVSAGPADASAGPPPDPQALEPYLPTRAESEPDGLTAAEEGRIGQPTLVMFHADWCHVCQEVMPTVHELRDRYDGRAAVVKLDVDDASSRAANQRYNVRGTPTFVVFADDGTEAQRFSGWPGETAVASLLDQLRAVQ